MQTLTGDLVELAKQGQYDVILQGCNCQCQMGKGIALTIKKAFPQAYAADLQTTKGDINKLGTISSATITINGKDLTVVNCYTQYDYNEGILTQADAVQACMKQVKQQYSGKTIGLPLIGCGLGKGDWNQIGPIIEKELEGENITLVVLPSN